MKKQKYTEVHFEMFTMPFGKYRGWSIEDLPVHYLLWIYKQDFCPPVLEAYILENEDDLLEEQESMDSFYDGY